MRTESLGGEDSTASITNVKSAPTHMGPTSATCPADGVVRRRETPDVVDLGPRSLPSDSSCFLDHFQLLYSPLQTAVGSGSTSPVHAMAEVRGFSFVCLGFISVWFWFYKTRFLCVTDLSVLKLDL